MVLDFQTVVAVLQEAAPPPTEWQITTNCYSTIWYYELYSLYLVGTLLMASFVFGRVGRRVGFISGRDSASLDHLLESFMKQDFAAITKRVVQLSPTSPESGLRVLDESVMSRPTALLSGLRMADASFRHSLQTLSNQTNAFLTMSGLTGLFIVIIATVGVANLFRIMSIERVSSLNAYAGGIAEILLRVVLGLLVLVVLFLFRRHLAKRIEQRRIAWEYFMNRVMALEYMIGAEKQAGEASNQV